MDNPGILVIEVWTHTGEPWATEYIFIKNYSCSSAPHCACFLGTENFTIRCDLAAAIVLCSKTSSRFAVSCNKYARALQRRFHKRRLRKSSGCLVNLNFVLHPYLYSVIDYAWDKRLVLLSHKWSALLDATAWLSTLGGGHSALGEHSSEHASMAGNLSVRQFKLALELGDKGLAYRCKLYYALSLIQKGQLSRSKALVRWIFNEARSNLKDQRLSVMCQGVWSKLRYHYSLLKQSKHLSCSCSNNCSSNLFNDGDRDR